MDLWVVAAATGAGYLTKYWQKFSRDKDKDRLLQFSLGDASLEKSETPSCPFGGHEDRKPVSGDRFSDRNQWGSVSETEVASTSGYDGENVGSLGYQYSNVLSLSNMPPVYLEDRNEHGDERRQSDDLDDNHGGERGSFRVPLSNKSSLRAERAYGSIAKPQNSLESCLMAQLYKKHAETIVPPSLSSPRMRQLIVSDGSRIISRATGDYLCAQIGVEPNKLHKKDHLETRENASGIHPLPKRGYKDLQKKMKVEGEKEWTGRSCSSRDIPRGKHLHLEGSPDGVVLLCLGISIGVISSVVANKKEVYKLEEVLKQTKSLVEDLQEELEMKDSVTLKEISNQNYGSQDTCDNSVCNRDLNLFSPAQNVDKYDGRDSYEQKAEESSESMSKIEAELEAELVRLGLNMNASTLRGRLTDLDELDPDLMADFAEGELRADMVLGHTVARPKSNENVSSASTADHCGNYAVSPRELSLRLHEVIQSRLEERIQELEEALQSSEKNITEPENKRAMESENKQIMESEIKRIMEPEKKDCLSDLSNSHSAVEESINSKEERQTIIEPLVMNLTGEALDAYNEAYAELMKLSESEGEDSPCQVLGTLRDQIPKQSYGVGGSVGRVSFEEEKWLGDEHSSRVECSNDSSVSNEEKSDSDGELEKQLIKQIVEKTKKGSPVVLNAQKWLFIDE